MTAPELRRTLRFKPKEGKVRILSDKGSGRPKESTNGEYAVSNVSIDGLCFKTPFQPSPGESLSIAFKTPHLPAPMNLACQVVLMLLTMRQLDSSKSPPDWSSVR